MMKSTRAPYWISPIVFSIGLLVVGGSLTQIVGDRLGLDVFGKVSFAQVVIEASLIPLAAFAFWQAREAVKLATSKPELSLMFLGEDGLLHDEYTMNIPESGDANRVTFALENAGDAIAVWWQVVFDLPVELLSKLREGPNKAGVQPRHVHNLFVDTVGSVEQYRIQSLGQMGAFPGTPLEVALLHATIGQSTQFEELYQIRYMVLTDRSAPVSGELPLRVVCTDKG